MATPCQVPCYQANIAPIMPWNNYHAAYQTGKPESCNVTPLGHEVTGETANHETESRG